VLRLNNSPGKIITFYSYKGGTGRSMVLANVAWILASNGKKVLAVDWDLEAQGLHRYFYPFLLDKDLTASEGIIDFVSDYSMAAMTPSPDKPYRRTGTFPMRIFCDMPYRWIGSFLVAAG
jgi:Mrp family chromosome partitioning ATPase